MEKYDMLRLIGKGSFGSVYLVSRRSDGAQFVMKKMAIRNVPDKEIESFQNEVRLLSELHHPSIVSHVESFIDSDKQNMCIVMIYCDGGDLTAFLKHKKGSKLLEKEVMYHFVQIALALFYMHEKNILHRDLKTQNIFMKDGLIQLGDFGISKALGGSNEFAQTCIGCLEENHAILLENGKSMKLNDLFALYENNPASMPLLLDEQGLGQRISSMYSGSSSVMYSISQNQPDRLMDYLVTPDHELTFSFAGNRQWPRFQFDQANNYYQICWLNTQMKETSIRIKILNGQVDDAESLEFDDAAETLAAAKLKAWKLFEFAFAAGDVLVTGDVVKLSARKVADFSAELLALLKPYVYRPQIHSPVSASVNSPVVCCSSELILELSNNLFPSNFLRFDSAASSGYSPIAIGDSFSILMLMQSNSMTNGIPKCHKFANLDKVFSELENFVAREIAIFNFNESNSIEEENSNWLAIIEEKLNLICSLRVSNVIGLGSSIERGILACCSKRLPSVIRFGVETHFLTCSGHEFILQAASEPDNSGILDNIYSSILLAWSDWQGVDASGERLFDYRGFVPESLKRTKVLMREGDDFPQYKFAGSINIKKVGMDNDSDAIASASPLSSRSYRWIGVIVADDRHNVVLSDGTVTGNTPYSMSPELFKNAKYNFKSDVWSLGCVLYEIVTMKHAFDANSINGLAQKIIKGVFPPISPSYSKPLRELIKSMLFVAPASRPSVKQILMMPFVRKSIKRFVSVVFSNQSSYREQDLNVFKQQLNKLGMTDLIDEALAANQAAQPAPVSVQSQQVSSSSAAPSDGSKRQLVVERDRRLNELAEEEKARKNLEAALERLQQAHDVKAKQMEAKKIGVPAVKKIVNPQSANANAAQMQQVAEEERRRKAAAAMSAAAQAKKAAELESQRRAEKEARDRQRRDWEADQKRREAAEMAAVERQRQAELEMMEEKRRLTQLAKKRREQLELQKEMEEEQRKRESARKREEEAKREAERIEIERIRSEREYLQKRLQSMDASRKSARTQAANQAQLPAAFDAPLAYKQKSHERNNSQQRNEAPAEEINSSLSRAEQVKAAKERKRQEEAEAELHRLREARKEYFQERIVAEQKNHQFKFGSAAPADPRANNSAANSNSNNYRQPAADEESSNDEIDNQSSEMLSASDEEVDEEEIVESGKEIADLQVQLMDYTRRIQDLRTSLQVTAKMELAFGDDEEDENDLNLYAEAESELDQEEEEFEEAVDEKSGGSKPAIGAGMAELALNMEQRRKNLAKECVRLVGKDVFIDVYEYLKNEGSAESEIDDETRQQNLMKIMGPDKLRHWRKIDQLIFMESC